VAIVENMYAVEQMNIWSKMELNRVNAWPVVVVVYQMHLERAVKHAQLVKVQ